MEQQLEQIEQLLSIFDEREKLMNVWNRKVAHVLTPTVLGALFDLFNLPHESVVWEDFSVIDTVLVIRVAVTYDPAHELSPFLTLLVPAQDGTSPIRVEKTIQFGVPLAKVFDKREDLAAWFMAVLRNSDGDLLNERPPEEQDATEPQPKLALTKDQIAQMLYFQKMYGGESQ